MATKLFSILTLSGFATTGFCFAQVPETAAPVPVPIAYYKANDSADDDSGQGQNASNPEEAEFGPGIEGSAFDFIRADTQGLRTELDVSPDMFPTMTWSAWVLPNQVDGLSNILSADRGGFDRALVIENGRFGIFTGQGILAQVEADLAQWQHIAVVFEPTGFRLYKNGQEFFLDEAPRYDGDFENLQIGRNPGFGNIFHGRIDEVEIYDQALSAEEIGNIYNKFRTQAEALRKVKTPVPVPEQIVEAPSTESAPSPKSALATMPPLQAPLETTHTEKVAITDEVKEASPEVIQAIEKTDPKGLAKALLKERWDHSLATDTSRPLKTLHKKLADGRGKPTFVVICWLGANQWGQENDTSIKDDGGAPIQTLALVSHRPETQTGELIPILVTSSKTAALSAIKAQGGDPSKIKIIIDREDSVRREMELFSTPYLFFDKDGFLVWTLQAGQRAKGNDTTGDLEEAITNVITGKYSIKAKHPPMLPKTDSTALFNFEDGPQGWQFSGDAWGETGTTSEADFPGLVKGFGGRHWLSTFPPNGPNPTGIAISPTFKIEKRYLHLKIGGGDLLPSQGVALVCEGSTPQLSTGKNTFEMDQVTWDLAYLIGKTARLVAYDNGTQEQRDGIMFDEVYSSDSPEPPPSFADHHDPNNQSHAALVADDLPADYKAFQNGDFHCSSKPGPTYLVEWTTQLFTQPGSRNLLHSMPLLPNTPGQTIQEQRAEIITDNKIIEAKLIKSKKTSYGDRLVLAYRKSVSEDKPVNYRFHALVTANNLTFERGPNPTLKPLPEETREEIKENHEEINTPQALKETKQMFKDEGIDRWPNETDSAYLLRAWRNLQRYWTGYASWGGRPISGKYKNGAEVMEAKSADCPAVGTLIENLAHAGIPTLWGPGAWADNSGNELGPHMRGLAYLNKVGWVLLDDDKGVYSPTGMFTFGRSTGDNYFQNILNTNKTGKSYRTTSQQTEEGQWSSQKVENQ